MPLGKLRKPPVLVGSVRALFLLIGLVALHPAGAQELAKGAAWQWQLPPGFPEPLVPAHNPMSAAKVKLGKLLFVERGLAVNGGLSCNDCHHSNSYFVDNVATPSGALGDVLPFNTPTLWNVAYSTSFSWIDKGLQELEAQHLGPLTNTDPIELGTSPERLRIVQAKPEIAAALAAAYPEQQGVLQLKTVAAALASYLRTLIKGGSAFDDYLFGDNQAALSAEAQQGLMLFTSQRLNCVSCHRGFLLSGPTRSAREAFPASFYATGAQTGLQANEAQDERMLAFRAPSLRFLRHTAPYMHDGSMNTLNEVIDFYAGADPAMLGPKAGLRMRPFKLTADERRALLAFLKSL